MRTHLRAREAPPQVAPRAPGGGRVARCAACKHLGIATPWTCVGEVFFCSECFGRSRMDDLSALYDDLGGGD